MSGNLSLKLSSLIVAIVASLGLFLSAVVLTAPATHAVPATTESNAQAICLGIPGNTLVDCPLVTDGTAQQTELSTAANNIINVFSIIIGIVSVIVIIVAGLRYIVSGGEASNVSNAKNQILYAVVGLIIVIFAQTIVKFVLAKF